MEVLKKTLKSGSTAEKEAWLIERAERFYEKMTGKESEQLTTEEIITAREALEQKEILTSRKNNGTILCSFKKYYDMEVAIKDDMERRAKETPDTTISEDVIKKLLSDKGFSDEHTETVWMGLNHFVSVITGGPGTGKTTTLSGLIEAIRWFYPDKEIILLAPTGKAARRMEGSTGLKAFTIHKVLKNIKGTSQDKGKIEQNFCIVDEASMIDTRLACRFLGSLSEKIHLILVGDKNKLEPVGPGQIFADIITHAKFIPRTELTHIYRQAEGNPIIKIAEDILQGNDLCEFEGRFTVTDTKDIIGTIISDFERLLKKGFSLEDIQILTPRRRNLEELLRLTNVYRSFFSRGAIPKRLPVERSTSGTGLSTQRTIMNSV